MVIFLRVGKRRVRAFVNKRNAKRFLGKEIKIAKRDRRKLRPNLVKENNIYFVVEGKRR